MTARLEFSAGLELATRLDPMPAILSAAIPERASVPNPIFFPTEVNNDFAPLVTDATRPPYSVALTLSKR